MTLDEAKQNLKQIEKEYFELKSKMDCAKEDVDNAIIDNLPLGFEIKTRFYSGSYDRYYVLYFNNKHVCETSSDENTEKLNLAKKAHELYKFMVDTNLV